MYFDFLYYLYFNLFGINQKLTYFLWQREELWPCYIVVTCVGDDDPEIKRDVEVSPVQLVIVYLRMLKNGSQTGVN